VLYDIQTLTNVEMFTYQHLSLEMQHVSLFLQSNKPSHGYLTILYLHFWQIFELIYQYQKHLVTQEFVHWEYTIGMQLTIQMDYSVEMIIELAWQIVFVNRTTIFYFLKWVCSISKKEKLCRRIFFNSRLFLWVNSIWKFNQNDRSFFFPLYFLIREREKSFR
jgi:hypothetical protein